ncbi:hypothetical protein [Larkinella terrae]|uniref:Uncharacterized protein n=1 Tax=Larkinella terrae TaxID=2025311 RepID=A0A7K0EE05_9BACT|nr:hypothetical protein [Larkinella terrae]MRS59811.1 hypothetical protein [Larkinella terrae]
MKYAVTYNGDQSVFELQADNQPPITFENHFAVFEYLKDRGLTEPDGDYIYDPVQKRFIFSGQHAL